MGSTELLFQTDSYQTSFEAKITAVRPDGGLVLDRTLFYYTSGGQPCDKGKIKRMSDGAQAEVVEVKKMDGEVVHYLQAPASPPAPGTEAALSTLSTPSFSPGDSVHGEIDWARRQRLMRMHTAGHVLSAVFFAKGVLITGNQLDLHQSRFDFSMEEFDRSLIDSVISEANRLCAEGHAVKVYSLPREEALKLPGFVKLANALPPALSVLRIVEIEGVDTQADGGTHVHNAREVGTVELVKVENKGAKNRRIYFTLKP
ncbi:Alanyl-tRNA editing protein AlaX-M [uncultured archaeon]|nr:Alanyl-tRNA editing protein AlaX-M [uncultured archaeon]